MRKDGMEQWRAWLDERLAFERSQAKPPQESRELGDLEGYESSLDSFAVEEEKRAETKSRKRDEEQDEVPFFHNTLKRRPYWR